MRESKGIQSFKAAKKKRREKRGVSRLSIGGVLDVKSNTKKTGGPPPILLRTKEIKIEKSFHICYPSNTKPPKNPCLEIISSRKSLQPMLDSLSTQ